MSKLVVGQVLHAPPRNQGSWTAYTVVSIGHKWATLSGVRNRCSLDTLMLDRGQYSHVQLHISREAYEEKQALRAAWRDLATRIDRINPPRGVTLETIAQVGVILGIGGES